MAMLDPYNTASNISLMRQHMGYMHIYDLSKLSEKVLLNTQYVSAMNPTAGSFIINPRLQRLFATFAIGFPSLDALNTIYATFLVGHLSKFGEEVQECGKRLVQAALQLHKRVAGTFRKTASNFHYEFNGASPGLDPATSGASLRLASVPLPPLLLLLTQTLPDRHPPPQCATSRASSRACSWASPNSSRCVKVPICAPCCHCRRAFLLIIVSLPASLTTSPASPVHVHVPCGFQEPLKIAQLWLHESERTYGDRLVSVSDLKKYKELGASARERNSGSSAPYDLVSAPHDLMLTSRFPPPCFP